MVSEYQIDEHSQSSTFDDSGERSCLEVTEIQRKNFQTYEEFQVCGQAAKGHSTVHMGRQKSPSIRRTRRGIPQWVLNLSR